MFKKVANATDRIGPISYAIPGRDSNLIASSFLNRMQVFQVAAIKERPPLSVYFLDSIYEITISKIPVNPEFSMKTGLKIERRITWQTLRTVYYDFHLMWNGHVKTLLKAAYPASEIWVTIAGDSIKAISSDSVQSFSLWCNSFSVRYGEHGPIDIFVSGVESVMEVLKPVSMGILLLRRDDGVYLLTVTSKDPKESIPPDLLYKVVHG